MVLLLLDFVSEMAPITTIPEPEPGSEHVLFSTIPLSEFRSLIPPSSKSAPQLVTVQFLILK